MWLFRSIYTSLDALPQHKHDVLELSSLIVNNPVRCLSGTDMMLLNGIELFAPWLQLYHQHFFESSKWNK